MAAEQRNSGDDIDVPVEAIQIIDPAVLEGCRSFVDGLDQSNSTSPSLPNKKIELTSITPHSSSLWTRTARLDGDIDGEAVRYFLKMTYGNRGQAMCMGEFKAMSQIHTSMSRANPESPAFVPRMIAQGTYETIPDVHFLLCEFRDMEHNLPDIKAFTKRMAEMHRSTSTEDGHFGFDCRTYHGNVPIEHGLSDTWDEYFTRTTRALLEEEQRVRGRNEDIQRLSKPFFEVVVPRLLRPLETEGRKLPKTLIHGDLWHGNVAIDKSTGLPMIFDAAGFYAHNEYELAVWRQPWNEIGEPYRIEYCKHFPPAEPSDEFDDRGLLYGTRVNILDSILYKDEDNYREAVISCMRQLVDKFPNQ